MVDLSTTGVLQILLPTAAWTVISAYVLWAANRAIRTCPRDAASDRHFVAVAAVACVLGALVLSWTFRAFSSGAPAFALLSSEWWYTNLWMVVIALGSAAFAARLYIGLVAARGTIRRGTPAAPDLARTTDRLRRAVGVRRRVRLIVAGDCDTPFTTGVLRPVIVVHARFGPLERSAQEAILLHELAHIRRGDVATELIAQALGVFLWWNPIYWITVRWIASLREQACDVLVLTHTRDRDGYAGLLSSFLPSRPGLPLNLAFATIGFADGGALGSRLRELPERPPLPRLYRFTPIAGEVTRWQLVLIVAAFACLLAAVDTITWDTLTMLCEEWAWVADTRVDPLPR